jgi:hypothetical protein
MVVTETEKGGGGDAVMHFTPSLLSGQALSAEA